MMLFHFTLSLKEALKMNIELNLLDHIRAVTSQKRPHSEIKKH